MKKLLVISSFPDQGEIHSSQTVGVASYTKNLLLAMAAGKPERPIEVWAEKLPGYDDYQEGIINVKRLWRRGDVVSLTKLLPELVRRKDDTLLVEFEVSMFGGPLATGWMVVLLMVARLLGCRPMVMMHQVLGDFRDLEGNNLLASLKNMARIVFYELIKLAASRLIVFEQQLKKNLGPGADIRVVPHFVYEPETTDRRAARERLGWDQSAKYLLCFGYIAPYKGIKELLEIWPDNTAWQLVIAGGVNPNHAQEPSLAAYVTDVKRLAAAKGIPVTGFVPGEKMPDYFAGADAMIFPYRTFMSSSGPLSFAFAYDKPVILSPALAAYAQTLDFAQAMKECQLTVDDITYRQSPSSLQAALKRLNFMGDRLAKLADTLGRTRSLAATAARVERALSDL